MRTLGDEAFAGGGALPALMGVVNVTPDSFFPKSRSSTIDEAVTNGLRMLDEGASIIDIGGESTRPGAEPVDSESEAQRVLPVIEGILKARPDAFISIDTMKPDVARKAVAIGCKMINDVSGAENPQMMSLVASTNVWLCVMHKKGDPGTMQNYPVYGNVVTEVGDYLASRVADLESNGVEPSKILIDPGIGFGKTLDHNLQLLRIGKDLIPRDDVRILWGVSRKRMFADLLGREMPSERLEGTLGVAATAFMMGIDVLRVHDVKEHNDLLTSMFHCSKDVVIK